MVDARQRIRPEGELGERLAYAGNTASIRLCPAVLRGASRVVAFEPRPDLVACFRRTFAKEIDSGQVTMVAKAVWEQSGTLAFDGAGLGFHAIDSQRPASTRTGPVMPVTTIDETIEALGLERVDFIKMDIEGAERQALRGACRTLARWRPNLSICAYHRPDDAEAIPAAIRDARPDYRVLATPGPAQETPSLLLRFPRADDQPRYAGRSPALDNHEIPVRPQDQAVCSAERMNRTNIRALRQA